MEAPCRMNARELRREKTKVLAATRMSKNIILGQYNGYRDEEGLILSSALLPILLVLIR